MTTTTTKRMREHEDEMEEEDGDQTERTTCGRQTLWAPRRPLPTYTRALR